MESIEIDSTFELLEKEFVGLKLPNEIFIGNIVVPFSDYTICSLIETMVITCLRKHNLESNWLEIKSFTGSPNFDIAAFRSFINLVIEKPWKLHSKHLLIKYKMENGVVEIEQIWLKNLWEICSSSGTWPVKVQYKNKVIVNIRPATWYSERTDFKPFDSLEDFLAAMEETIYQYPDTRVTIALHWKDRLIESYERRYGVHLNIPRWNDIADKYANESAK